MKKLHFLFLILLLISFQFTNSVNAQNIPAEKSKIKLVLQLTVDQLRGDMFNKFENNLTNSGFKYLLKNGAEFTNAKYIHAITKTAPGHATLATGSFPAIHGIVNNDWYDSKIGKMTYSCEDKNYSVFDDDDKLGRSPNKLKASTTADEIFISNDGKSKIFGVSVKDRGAIYLAGFSGKAFWFSKKNGHFTSSTYYYDSLPDWVKQWNDLNQADVYYEKNWNLLLDKTAYQYTDEDYNKYEYSREGLGNDFPHKFDKLSKEKFYEYIPYTPYGDKLTLSFAERLIEIEDIGKDDIVDYLSISFSCTDYIGHLFGPNSMEYEDQILNLDKVLSELFNYIDEHVGLESTLIILSADHGVCESPEFLKDRKITTGILEMDNLVDAGNKFGRDSLELNFDVIHNEVTPYFYLDSKKIADTKYSSDEIENKLANYLTKFPGVYKVFTSAEMEKGHFQTHDIGQYVVNAYYKGRSGQLYVVGDPNWYVTGSAERRDNSATHGTPWTYDRFVPLLFGGAGIAHSEIHNTVGPQDIAPSICDFLKIKIPSGAVGNSLLKYLKFSH